MTRSAVSVVLLAIQIATGAVLPTIALVQGNVATAQDDLDRPFGKDPKAGFTAWTNEAFRFGLILVVLAAAIYIAIGAYMYFAASGNAELAKTGKEYITRAVMGLVLGLVAWVILQTISPQFAKELTDPSLSPAP